MPNMKVVAKEAGESTQQFSQFYGENQLAPKTLGVEFFKYLTPDFILSQIENLPAEVGVFLQTELRVLGEQTTETMAGLIDEIAARSLLDKFGLPESALAWPVWKSLELTLQKTKKATREQMALLKPIVDQLQALLQQELIQAKKVEIEAAQTSIKEDKNMLAEMGQMNLDDEPGLNNKLQTAKTKVQERINGTKKHLANLKITLRKWLNPIENLSINFFSAKQQSQQNLVAL